MSRFNTAAVASRPRVATPTTTNLAGGDAFVQNAKLELASILLTSMVKDQFYRGADDTLERVRTLLGQVDPVFAAKAAVFARNEYGMRSITHALAGEVAGRVKGEQWTKRFFEGVVRRPDDMTEILAYFLANYGKPVPNSLKKGLAAAFGKFDEYQLAKYRGDNNALSLVDVANLVHPRPTDKNREALRKLVNGTLRSKDTWETKVSQAGKAENADEAKAEAWAELLQSGKLGYFALLRNLRNIETQAPALIPAACEALVNEKQIRNSLVLPFRYLTALEQVSDRRVIQALSRALDISMSNVPALDGKTLVVVDHSGSMGEGPGSPKYIGDTFAAALYKSNDADVMVFGSYAGYVTGINPDDSTLTVAKAIGRVNYGHGTSFPAIFETANRGYERVIILSDMQGWMGSYYGTHPGKPFEDWKKKTKSSPHVYSFDLQGYGSLQFPEDRVYCLAGFSEKVFDVMEALEADRNALVHKIEAVTL